MSEEKFKYWNCVCARGLESVICGCLKPSVQVWKRNKEMSKGRVKLLVKFVNPVSKKYVDNVIGRYLQLITSFTYDSSKMVNYRKIKYQPKEMRTYFVEMFSNRTL